MAGSADRGRHDPREAPGPGWRWHRQPRASAALTPNCSQAAVDAAASWCLASKSGDGSAAERWRCSDGSRGPASRALARRWTALAALAAMRAHAQSLLELPAQPVDASDGADISLGELLVERPLADWNQTLASGRCKKARHKKKRF